MKPHEPINGCIHGCAVDSALHGLTKREWLIGKALEGAMAAGAIPKEAAQEAIQAADATIAALTAVSTPPAPQPVATPDASLSDN